MVDAIPTDTNGRIDMGEDMPPIKLFYSTEPIEFSDASDIFHVDEESTESDADKWKPNWEISFNATVEYHDLIGTIFRKSMQTLVVKTKRLPRKRKKFLKRYLEKLIKQKIKIHYERKITAFKAL